MSLGDRVASWDALLAAAKLPRLEARALLEHASGRARTWLVAHGNERADPETAERFVELVRRRIGGEPIAQIVGWREFHGLRLQVDPHVLIPRADTETLVDWALEIAPIGARVLDLGTGSGAIVLALAQTRADLRLTAVDRSAASLSVARSNALRLVAPRRSGGPIRWLLGDWCEALPQGEAPFDLIVSNPPYLSDDDPHLTEGDLRFEPRQALVAGADGLDDIRRIIGQAASRLSHGAMLMLEHGHLQGPAVRAAFEAAGWCAVQTRRDAGDRERVTAARIRV